MSIDIHELRAKIAHHRFRIDGALDEDYDEAGEPMTAVAHLTEAALAADRALDQMTLLAEDALSALASGDRQAALADLRVMVSGKLP